MRKKDEEVIKKVVDKIIDSKVLLTGDGDFCVDTCEDKITSIDFRNLFSAESSIKAVRVFLYNVRLTYIDENTYSRKTYKNHRIILYKGGDSNERFGDDDATDLATSPSFKRLVEYIEENKHLILHNDKEYGKSHTLTDADFI
jgi:hypothetical protein